MKPPNPTSPTPSLSRCGFRLTPVLLLVLLPGCSPKSKSLSEAAPDQRAEWVAAAREARANLAVFYLRTFGPLIRSGYYDEELPVVGPDHYAHRLWVPG